MNQDIEHKIVAILKILNREKKPVGANFISEQLKEYGISLSERAVRYHLKIMDERGLTHGYGKRGRMITSKGREELENALVQDKVGFAISRISTLSYLTSFDVKRKSGSVIMNVSLIPEGEFKRSLKIMEGAFRAKLCTSDMVKLAYPGEKIGEFEIPRGKVGFGTICSVTIDGVLLKAGIPVEPKFAGIVQVLREKPLRFTEIITYEGSSLDPLEIFIASGMTSVGKVAQIGEGKILAGFREIPTASLKKAQQIIGALDGLGLGKVLSLGAPSQPVLEAPVGMDRVGFVVAGGLNPLAALGEVGINVENRAMSTLVDFGKLEKFECLKACC